MTSGKSTQPEYTDLAQGGAPKGMPVPRQLSSPNVPAAGPVGLGGARSLG
jgi:hypothetical protein